MIEKYLLVLWLGIMCCCPRYALSQDTLKYYPNSTNSINKAASKLSKSLSTSKPEEEIAKEYEDLAGELIKKNEYVKAEEYLVKANDIYTRLNKKRKISSVNRQLARLREQQQNYQEAIQYYEEASLKSNDEIDKQVNQNDANRLRNQLNPVAQSEYIQSNIRLLEKDGRKEDQAIAYQQMAETKMQLNQPAEAIQNYEKALENVDNKQNKAIEIKGEIAKVYVADKKFDKAIDLKKELIEEAKQIKDIKTEINELRSLSSIYFIDNQADEGIEILTQSYNLSIEKGQTFEAKKSLEELVAQYRKRSDDQKIILLYQNFLGNLEEIIRSDTSLVDVKLFQLTENKIQQLEKERALKDELIRRKNIFNYVLIGSIVFMLVLMLLIFKAWYTIRIRNKKIALQSLRREMNPHFIFNSLNSVNQFIAQNDELEANKYLTSYSRLMRNIMDNSNKDFIRLSNEIEQLKEYLDLEHLRFKEKFTYRIIVDEQIDTDMVSIPNMIIQPHLENAIWHGLRYRDDADGILQLSFSLNENHIVVVVDDNGIGLKKSEEIKTRNQKVHKSRGLINITERIRLLNSLYHQQITISIREKEKPDQGVIVVISFPYDRNQYT